MTLIPDNQRPIQVVPHTSKIYSDIDPIYQTINTKEDGNCFQAALASVLRLPLAAVPHFYETENYKAKGPDGVYDEIREWIKQYSLDIICVDWYKDGTRKPHGICLAQGTHPQSTHEHVVVFKDGELYWDPDPNANLTDMTKFKPAVYWLFMTLNPSAHMEGLS